MIFLGSTFFGFFLTFSLLQTVFLGFEEYPFGQTTFLQVVSTKS